MLVLLASGCGFETTNEGELPDGPAGQIDPQDPDPTIARKCAVGDAALRLCIDFEDATTLAFDASGNDHVTTVATALAVMPRDAEQAVSVTSQSRLVIGESPLLDITANLTTSLWFNPSGFDDDAWLLDNNAQYFISYDEGGFLRCGIANESVRAAVPVWDSWHHVACAYDGQTLKLYLDGSVAGCKRLDRAMPTSGTVGLAIGSNVGASGQSLSFADVFAGGLDNVQVLARTLSDGEACAAAGQTGCWSQCPPIVLGGD